MSIEPTSKIEVTTFEPQYVTTYAALNRQWIEEHFEIEPMDEAQLGNPQANILDRGGEIFFVLENGRAVATCALVPHGPAEFELAKMAVAPEARGRGYGNVLMQAAFSWARAQGAAKIILLSNTILAPAIALYTKHGFETTHLGPHPDYQRCNIVMELRLR